jgi:cobalt/nickel transport protein
VRDALRSPAFWIIAAVAAVAAGVLSYFASPAPDALEYSLERHAPEEPANITVEATAAVEGGYDAPLLDYSAPPLSDRPFLSGGVAGLIGAAAVFALIVAAGYLLKRGKAGKGAAGG